METRPLEESLEERQKGRIGVEGGAVEGRERQEGGREGG